MSKTEELIDGILSDIKKAPEEKSKNIRIFKDVRIFTNTIKQAVDMMKKSGIAAKASKVENAEFIEYTIKIPKTLKKAV